MEQNQLSKSAITQIAGSALILLSVFMSWFSFGDYFSLSMTEFFKASAEDAAILTIVPWVVALLALGNIVFVFLKNKKMLTIALTVCMLLVVGFAIIAMHDAREFKEASLGTGFFLAVIGVVALVCGLFMRKKSYEGK